MKELTELSTELQITPEYRFSEQAFRNFLPIFIGWYEAFPAAYAWKTKLRSNTIRARIKDAARAYITFQYECGIRAGLDIDTFRQRWNESIIVSPQAGYWVMCSQVADPTKFILTGEKIELDQRFLITRENNYAFKMVVSEITDLIAICHLASRGAFEEENCPAYVELDDMYLSDLRAWITDAIEKNKYPNVTIREVKNNHYIIL